MTDDLTVEPRDRGPRVRRRPGRAPADRRRARGRRPAARGGARPARARRRAAGALRAAADRRRAAGPAARPASRRRPRGARRRPDEAVEEPGDVTGRVTQRQAREAGRSRESLDAALERQGEHSTGSKPATCREQVYTRPDAGHPKESSHRADPAEPHRARRPARPRRGPARPARRSRSARRSSRPSPVTGGHLGSSLGVVELTIALHRLLESPRDRIVWDTGHQAYPHKLLTGRLERFGTLRQLDGVGGFPRRSESPHDVFDGGHAGTGLSIAEGLAEARDLRHGLERIAVVVGDAALMSGLSLEALNDIGQRQTQMLIVVNDNEMSISPTVGAFSKYLSQIKLSSDVAARARAPTTGRVERIPVVGPTVLELVAAAAHVGRPASPSPASCSRTSGSPTSASCPGTTCTRCSRRSARALALPGPTIVHVRTQKGRGYRPAETDQIGFHGAALPPMAPPARWPAGHGERGHGKADRGRRRARRADADRVDGRRRGAADPRPAAAEEAPELHGGLRRRADRARPRRTGGSSGSPRACRPAPACRSSRPSSRTGSSTSGSPSSTP